MYAHTRTQGVFFHFDAGTMKMLPTPVSYTPTSPKQSNCTFAVISLGTLEGYNVSWEVKYQLVLVSRFGIHGFSHPWIP